MSFLLVGARVVLGLILLFLPGILLSFLLLPSKPLLHRILYSFGLGVFLLLVLGFLLSVLSVSMQQPLITEQIIGLSLFLLSGIFGVLLWTKRRG